MQNRFNRYQKILGLLIIVVGLVLVRVFEKRLFDDPYLAFFHSDSFGNQLPDCNGFLLGLGYFFRYGLNTILSLAAIYVIFEDLKLLKFASIMYLAFFAILMILLFSIRALDESSLNMILFYVRRFVIQPVLLLLFVPAFFYQKKMSR